MKPFKQVTIAILQLTHVLRAAYCTLSNVTCNRMTGSGDLVVYSSNLESINVNITLPTPVIYFAVVDQRNQQAYLVRDSSRGSSAGSSVKMII